MNANTKLRLYSIQSFSYWVFLTLCFMLFQQVDLLHTYTSSYAYLSGHFADFYDYNKQKVGGNDYLPLLYLIFALWNLPLYLFDLISAPDLMGGERVLIELAWSKFLLVIFFFGSVKTLLLITREIIGKDYQDAGYFPSFIFATSPITIFSVFIFGQYDIIGLFFSLIGYYFYLKKDLFKFTIFFAIAISFKYFAFVIFVPLILMVEKNLLKLIMWFVIAWLAVIIQIILYAHSSIFLDEIFELLRVKVVGSSYERVSLKSPIIYCAFGYALACCYLYFKRFASDEEWRRTAVFVPILAYALMFTAVIWHPQWLIILMPFFALSYLYIINVRLLAIIDILAMFLFVWFCVITWPNHVDVTMIKNGMLGQFLPLPNHIGSDFLAERPRKLFRVFLSIYLFSPILLYVFERYTQKLLPESKNLSFQWIYIRFFWGNIFFPLLVILCYL